MQNLFDLSKHKDFTKKYIEGYKNRRARKFDFYFILYIIKNKNNDN